MSSKPLVEARLRNERPHVLIVSDDRSLVSFLEQGLPHGGFWTSTIGSGLQALEVFRLRQFDLIIIDLQLQSFDAWELLRRLRGVSTRDTATTARSHAPVVLVSDHAAKLDRDEGHRLEVASTWSAPFELEEIVGALHGAFADWRRDHPDDQLADALAMRSV